MSGGTEESGFADEGWPGIPPLPDAASPDRPAGMAGLAEPEPQSEMPPAVTGFGPVELELMGHRYRRGILAEVVIAGTPFLRLTPSSGNPEYYRPDAVYCITPTVLREPAAALPAGEPWDNACICGPDSTGEAPDERPDCPVHGIEEVPF